MSEGGTIFIGTDADKDNLLCIDQTIRNTNNKDFLSQELSVDLNKVGEEGAGGLSIFQLIYSIFFLNFRNLFFKSVIEFIGLNRSSNISYSLERIKNIFANPHHTSLYPK